MQSLNNSLVPKTVLLSLSVAIESQVAITSLKLMGPGSWNAKTYLKLNSHIFVLGYCILSNYYFYFTIWDSG